MPDDYVQFIFNVTIVKLLVILLDEITQVDQEHPLTKLTLDGVRVKAKIGQDFQDIDVGIGALTVKDYVANSAIFRYLIETVYSDDKDSDDALIIIFRNHPKFEGGKMKIAIQTNAALYIFVNMKLINQIQKFANLGEKPEDKIDISYYTDRARVAAVEYMNVGADYLEKARKEGKYIHQTIDADLDILAPIIFIPEDINIIKNTKALVIDIGYINADSLLQEYNNKNDYENYTSPDDLYDKYSLEYTGLQATMIEELSDYK